MRTPINHAIVMDVCASLAATRGAIPLATPEMIAVLSILHAPCAHTADPSSVFSMWKFWLTD